MSTVLCGSHLPLLVKIMERVDKPVLELGMGYNSTPLLHWLCKEKELDLLSVESDEEWMTKFKEFDSDTHFISHFDFNDWNKTQIGKHNEEFGLVFVDHRPARKRRHSALYFKDKADYIILHDSELADTPAYKYRPIYNQFKYIYEYKKCGTPYTMVLSNKKDLSWLKP